MIIATRIKQGTKVKKLVRFRSYRVGIRYVSAADRTDKKRLIPNNKLSGTNSGGLEYSSAGV